MDHHLRNETLTKVLIKLGLQNKRGQQLVLGLGTNRTKKEQTLQYAVPEK